MIQHIIINIINKTILVIFSIYVLILLSVFGTSIGENVYNIINKLILNDKSLIKLDLLSNNCFKKYKYTKNSEYDNYKSSNERLVKKGEIPIKYYNDNIKQNSDLYLTDFFWKFSYKTYLSSSIHKCRPSYDSIINSISLFGTRGIHLDIYSNSKIIGDVNAIPIIRCETLYDGFEPLDLYKSLELINDNAWNNQLPLILYLTLNFNDGANICNKIYHSIMDIFKNKLIDKKYSFNGRNMLYSINKIKMEDALNKVIIVTNKYPTNSKLDELINGSITNKLSNISIDKYTKELSEYGGITSKYSPTDFINMTKENLFMFYSNDDSKKNTLMKSKTDLNNPDIIDCCKHGVQFSMMSLSYPDNNLEKWNNFFGKSSYILKNKNLRNIENQKVIIKKDVIKKIPKNLDLGYFMINT
tara:strand:- start:1058 stop:2299 length:1242 start_codon:yes stop_codon:yes gene_type:complete